MTDFFKAIGALAAMVVALIALANAVGWPPKPAPTAPPVTTPVTVAPPVGVPAADDGATRTIPDVTGVEMLQAVNRLQDDGFQPRPGGFEESDTVAFGDVVRTEPPAGSQVTKGSPVTLITSSGPPH